jgi:predicted O-methyltransferase YrrM
MIQALADVLHAETSDVEACVREPTFNNLLGELEGVRVPAQARPMSGAAYLELCYAVVRLLRPAQVIETGVALGYSTAAVLQALGDNGTGHLTSVDLPVFSPGTTRFTAMAVPDQLRDPLRWRLFFGPDRQVLPSVLERLGAIDVFFYDSDKSYRGMRKTWMLAWPHLKPGGVLIADDIHMHDAFFEFCEEVGSEPVVVAKPRDHGVYHWSETYYVGLLRKPDERS